MAVDGQNYTSTTLNYNNYVNTRDSVDFFFMKSRLFILPWKIILLVLVVHSYLVNKSLHFCLHIRKVCQVEDDPL